MVFKQQQCNRDDFYPAQHFGFVDRDRQCLAVVIFCLCIVTWHFVFRDWELFLAQQVVLFQCKIATSTIKLKTTESFLSVKQTNLRV